MQFFRGRLAPIGPAVASVSPDVVRLVWGSGRTHAAPLWRKLVRLAVVLSGFAVFAALEYELAILIQAEDWFHAGMIFGAIITLAVTLFSVPTAFVGWLVMSPWVGLFWREAVGGALALTFDRVMILLLLIVVVARRMVKREPLRALQFPEWMLLASFLYIKVVPHVGTMPSMIWGLNVFMDSLVSPFIIYIVAKECITNKTQIAAMSVGVLAGGIVWSLTGFYEHYLGKMWLSPIIGQDIQLAWTDVAQGRAAGPANHYYVYGGVLILTTFLALHLGVSAKQAGVRFLCIVGAAVTIVALYFGYSRAPYLALALSLLIAPFFVKRGRSVYTVAAVAVLMVGVIAVASLSTSTQTSRFSSLDSVYGRAVIYRTMLNMIKDHFWLGVGYDKSGDYVAQYVSSLTHPHWTTRTGRYGYSLAHNEYLVVFAEQGLIGFALYFAAVISLAVQMLRVRARLPDNGLLGKGIVLPVLLLVMSYFIMGTADQFQLNQYLYYLMFAMVAMVIRLGELQREDDTADAEASGTDMTAHGLVAAVRK